MIKVIQGVTDGVKAAMVWTGPNYYTARLTGSGHVNWGTDCQGYTPMGVVEGSRRFIAEPKVPESTLVPFTR